MVGSFHVACGVYTSDVPRFSLVMLGQLIPNRLQFLAMTTPWCVEGYDPFAHFGVLDDSTSRSGQGCKRVELTHSIKYSLLTCRPFRAREPYRQRGKTKAQRSPGTRTRAAFFWNNVAPFERSAFKKTLKMSNQNTENSQISQIKNRSVGRSLACLPNPATSNQQKMRQSKPSAIYLLIRGSDATGSKRANKLFPFGHASHHHHSHVWGVESKYFIIIRASNGPSRSKQYLMEWMNMLIFLASCSKNMKTG